MVYFEARKVRSLLQLIIAPLMLGGLLFLSNCNPADRYQYHYPISQETKDYCYFKDGSWWVYVDSNKMVYDTVRCISSLVLKDDNPEAFYVPVELFLCRFYSSYLAGNYEYQLPGGMFDSSLVRNTINVNIPPNYMYHIIFFTNENSMSLEYDSKTIQWMKEIHKIGQFSEIKTFQTFGDRLPNELPYMISWAPHVGIVYKAMPDGANWELIDYEVLQP